MISSYIPPFGIYFCGVSLGVQITCPTKVRVTYILSKDKKCPETFKNVFKDQSVDTSKVKRLSDDSKIGVCLKDLKSSGAIKESKRECTKNRERVYYTIKPLGATYTGGHQENVIDDDIINLIREISYDRERVVRVIPSYKQYDIFTVLMHIRHLLTSMTIYGYERLLPSEERVDYDNVLDNGLLNLKKLDKKPVDFWVKL